MFAFGDDIHTEAFAIPVIEYLRVNSRSYGKGVVQRRPFGDGEDFCVSAGKEGYDLGKQSA